MNAPRWLFKSEPSCYSYANLVRDNATIWDGITNAQARINLRLVEKGDLIFFYHTGDEKAIVGIMKAVSGPKSDPALDDEKAVVVEVKPLKALAAPVTLAQIKADPKLADWALVRNSRLSVVPVNNSQWKQIEQLIVE